MLCVLWKGFEIFSYKFVSAFACDLAPTAPPVAPVVPPVVPAVSAPEKSLEEQLKELLPEIVAFKDILGDAVKDHSSVKDLKEQLKNLDGSVTDLSSKIIKLGKREINVRATGWDAEKKMDFVKFVVGVGRIGKNYPNAEKSFGTIKEVQAKYVGYGKDPDLNIGTDADGGFLVPEPFRDQIWRIAEDASLALQMATIAPLTRGNKIPVLSLGSSVSAFWTAEAAPLTQSDPTFAKDEQEARKLAAYSVMSNEILEDEEVGVADLLVTLFGEAMAIKIDAQFFNGLGTGVALQQPFTGIMQKAGINSVIMAGAGFSSIDFDDMADSITQIKRSALNGAKFVMHRTIENIFKKIKDSDGNYIWGPPTAGSPATIWGWPRELNDQMPALTDSDANTPFVIFGNLKNVLIGVKAEMSIRVTDLPFILTDQTVMVVRRRLAIIVALPGAFSVIKTGTGS